MYLKRVTEQIRLVMEEKGMSQREMASRLGMSPTTLNKMLKGSGNLQMNTLFEIADVLKIEPMVLLSPSEDWLLAWESFAALSPSRRRTAVSLLHDLATLDRQQAG